jgi:hypothetical protein
MRIVYKLLRSATQWDAIRLNTS